jgi:CDP-diacylglycerol--serine O-phosphatidyltransferase
MNNMIKKSIPNTVTLMNLFCGCIGIVCAFNDRLEWAGYAIGIAAVLDFLDGFLARILKVRSELGAQLDSFSDAVSFGVLPGIILFQLLSISFGEYFTPFEEREASHLLVQFLAFLVPMFSVLRLAKFNLDENQAYGFIGLPTPASAIFIGSLPLILASYNFNFYNPIIGDLLGATADNLYWGELKFYTVGTLQDTWFLSIISVVISLLLVAPIPLIALKFKGVSWGENKDKFIFIGIVLLMLLLTAQPYLFYIKGMPVLDYLVIPLIILVYVVYSLVQPLLFKRN